MKKHAPEVWARYVVIVGAFLFVLDLFLDWKKADVDVAGVISVHATSSGWTGWGVAAGILAIAVIATAVTRRAAWTLGLAAAMLVATALGAFTGDADVSTAVVGVAVDTTLWPAWVGLGLATMTAAAAAVPFLPLLTAMPRRLTPHGTA